MTAYSLDLRDSNIGGISNEPEYFIVGVMDDDNDRDICLLRFGFEDDGTHVSCNDPQAAAEQIEKCNGDLHLIAVATTAIMNAQTEDHELITDMFYDDDVNSVSIPLTF